MLPLTLLKSAQGHDILVELKSGETYNGKLLNCDSWMNLNLVKVICTSRDGEKFWKMESVYIRGHTIKYLSFHQYIYDKCPDEAVPASQKKSFRSSGRDRKRGRVRKNDDDQANSSWTQNREGRGRNTSSTGRSRRAPNSSSRGRARENNFHYATKNLQ